MMMKNTEAIPIKIIGLMAAAFFLWGCHSHVHKETAAERSELKEEIKKTISSIPKKSKAPKIVALSNANVEKELLSYGAKNPETLVRLTTPKGTMTLRLYENTPLHRANFIRLVKNNFYSETVFYRVVEDFMIQGGDNDDWERQGIKDKMGKYTLPAEIRSENIHKRGALSMAREYENNPELRSVPYEFFIVQGTRYSESELRGAEMEYGLKISPGHQELYKTLGGTPHLDGQHTVFGEVIEGLSVIDSIAAVKVDEGDWPIQNITLEFQVLK